MSYENTCACKFLGNIMLILFIQEGQALNIHNLV